MTTLLTWSDRGVASPRPAHHVQRPRSDRGPVLRAVQQDESCGRYHRAVILCSEAGAAAAADLRSDLEPYIPSVELRSLPLPDPSDHESIFLAVRDATADLASGEPVDVILSSGTPQMQTIWVVLVKAGLLDARMLQVIPSAFVPLPHPKALKEVRIDFHGFPEIVALREEVARLRAEVRLSDRQLVGKSAPMRALRRLVVRVARSDVPVLVHGPTGSGKELVARSIHHHSRRADGPLVAENCGALSDSVLQSELFGHEKGAFTGAQEMRRGLFERAHGGTLILDEVGEMSPRVQVSLLRVLQEGTLRRLGGDELIPVDVRVIAATHRDLRAMVDDGSFREDLYYRLRGAVLTVPALAQRPDDIPPLVETFLADFSDAPRVSDAAMRALSQYAWPGNVRELRAEVVRWTVFCDERVRFMDLAPEIRGHSAPAPAPESETPPLTLKQLVRRVEDEHIAHVLEQTAHNLSETARRLDIDRNTLKRKMARMGLR